jgi:two-component system, LytTR family, sensor kinase
MNRNKLYWVCQIAGWIAYFMLALLTDRQIISSTFNDRFLLILFCAFGLAISHLLRQYYKTSYFKNIPIEKLIVRSSVAIIIATFSLFATYIIIARIVDIQLYAYIQQNFLPSIIGTSFIYIMWSIIYFISKFVVNNRRMVIEGLQMESNVKSLEIKNIKNHLQPHFIFNALNSIRALVDENPTHAREAITQLSNILRSSIQVDKVESLPLKKELEIVKDYLSLERIRYEERLQVTYNIQDNTLELPIPPLLLQTLVENAIKHGIAAFVDGGIIEINSFMASKFHVITIRNTGHYEKGASVSASTGEGFGLESSKERLQYLFGKEASLHIKNIPNNLVELTIQIPHSN